MIGYPPIFRILLSPHNFTASQSFSNSIVSKYITSICLKACHDHMMKAKFAMKYLFLCFFRKQNAKILYRKLQHNYDIKT